MEYRKIKSQVRRICILHLILLLGYSLYFCRNVFRRTKRIICTMTSRIHARDFYPSVRLRANSIAVLAFFLFPFSPKFFLWLQCLRSNTTCLVQKSNPSGNSSMIFHGVFNLFFFFVSFFYCFAYLIGWIFVYAVFFVVVIRLRFLC